MRVCQNQPLGLCKVAGCIFILTQLKTSFGQQKSCETSHKRRECLFWFPSGGNSCESSTTPLVLQGDGVFLFLFFHPQLLQGFARQLPCPPNVCFPLPVKSFLSTIWGCCSAYLALSKSPGMENTKSGQKDYCNINVKHTLDIFLTPVVCP